MATLIPMPLDEGTKINIADDENKILDTGPTGRGLNPVTPASASFSVSPRVSCVSCGRYVRTHTRRACHVGLNGGICIFYKPGVICIPGCPGPCVPRGAIVASAGTRAPNRYRFVDLSPVRIALVGAMSDQAAPLRVRAASTLPFITPDAPIRR